MGIFYLVSIILLIVGVMLIKKSENKLNFIGTLVVTIVGFLCYQVIIAYFLDLVRIPITLITYAILNNVIFIVLISIVFKQKQIQKYEIKKQDLIFILIMLLINLPILYKEFGLLENFRYTSTDSVMHCQAAITFSKGDYLLDSMTNWEPVSPTFMIAGYVNSGMLMKALVGFIGEFNLYKVYMFMDILYYLMIGIVFYLLITSLKKVNSIGKYLLAFIISIIFMIGYPLNAMISGFHYFTLGLLEFITIIYVLNVVELNSKKVESTLLILLNTAIMFTYNLFAPIIYFAEFIYFIYQAKIKEEKIFSKKFILKIISILFIPGIIGVSFFFFPRIIGNIGSENPQQLGLEGYGYINFWSNIIILIPFAIYFCYKKIKQKEINIEIIMFLTISIFMVIFYIGLALDYVSTYYLMKLYYVLNIILFILFFRSLCIIMDEGKIGKIISTLIITFYCTLLIFNLAFVKVGAYDFQTKKENLGKLFDIYNTNKAIIEHVQIMFTDDRIDALEYIHNNNLIQGQNLLYLGDYIDNFLFKMFFTYENREGIDKLNIDEHIQMWNDGKYDYLVVFLKNLYLEYYSEKLELQNSKIIFESPNSIIYEFVEN